MTNVVEPQIVNYRQLTQREQYSIIRCGVVAENQMQCPERANVAVLDPGYPSYMCGFHIANALATSTMDNKKFVLMKNEE